MNLTDKIKVGDTVTRMLAGTIPTELKIVSIDEKTNTFMAGAWKFDIKTGIEIDEDLHWGPEYGTSGSFIKPF